MYKILKHNSNRRLEYKNWIDSFYVRLNKVFFNKQGKPNPYILYFLEKYLRFLYMVLINSNIYFFKSVSNFQKICKSFKIFKNSLL